MRLPTQEQTTADDDPTADGRQEPVPGDDAAGDDAGTVSNDDVVRKRPVGDILRRWRPAAARVTTVLAGLLLLFALLLPNQTSRLTPGWFVRIPVEGLLIVGLLLALQPRPRRVMAALAGVGLGLMVILKIADMGFYSVLGRPFDLVLDWIMLDYGLEFLTQSTGRLGAIGVVIAAAVLVIGVLILMTLAALRVTRLVVRHHTTATRTVAALAAVWVACAVLGAQIVPGVPVAAKNTATIVHNRALQVGVGLRDQKIFAGQLAVDNFRETPDDQLLTALRGKDVILTFVESYGRDAVEDPEFASQVGAVLAAGNQRLGAAGFASRSAFLTSPIAGGGSWMAHDTFLSGLWVDNEQRHRTLLASDRLTLNGAFHRASWRTVGVMPGNSRDWPEGEFFGYDQVYDSRNLGYRGPRFGWARMPDQYTLSAFERLERATPGRAPVMAEIPLLSSHTPWAPIPRLIDWDDLGDGSVFDAIAKEGYPKSVVWSSVTRVRTEYRRSIEYSLNTLISYLETYGDDDTVLVFLGDHQPVPLITGEGASHDVPITIVARDPAVLDRISGWGWQDGLKPGPRAPVWRMDAFRDRFLTAFGPQAAATPSASPPTR